MMNCLLIFRWSMSVHGKEVFNSEMIETVNKQMKLQYNQTVDDWMEILNK